MGCRNLAYIEVDEENADFYDIDGVLFTKDGRLKKFPYAYANVNEDYAQTGKYTVPDGITQIAAYAFTGVSTLKDIDLNDAATLKYRSFYNCNYLTRVKIPKDMTSIPGGSFDNCNQISYYEVEEGNTKYANDEQGVIYSADFKTLIQYPIGRSGNYDILSSAEAISSDAFAASKISSVTIPPSVKTIGTRAFSSCSSLKSVTFTEPSSLTSLGNSVFKGCAFETITLPQSLVTIGSTAFQSCSKLKTVNIADGSKLKTIQSNAFLYCSSLEEFNFEGSCTLETIQSSAFANLSKLKGFDFPASVKTIDTRAFDNCKSMEYAIFADDAEITTIGSNAFANSGIKTIVIPNKVQTINQEAFLNCDVLTKVELPASCTSVNSRAFKGCSTLKEIIVDENNPTYSSVQGFLCSKDKSTLVLFPPGAARKDFTLLPPSLTAIGDYAFYDCQELTNISIPAKVNTIGKRAFGLDENLASIAFLCDEPILPENIKQDLNEAAFDDGVTTAENRFGNITIYVRKELVEKYRSESPYKEFYSKFKEIKTSFTMAHEGDADLDNAGDEFFPMSNTAVNLLNTSAQVNTYLVPETVTNPEDGVTYNVALIGDYAFEGASSNIEEVVVKSNVGYIGAMAFLTQVERTGDNKIKPVGSSIKQVVFTTTTPAEWLSTNYFGLTSDFNEFTSEQKIYVKKSCENTYKSAWPTFTDQISYQIPGISISTKYGTFSREFDVDLSDFSALSGTDRVLAFTANAELREGTGDYGTETEYYVHMHSINEGQDGDGTYIPAGTGVLLKAWDAEATADGFYYTIGERDLNEAAESVMMPVTINDRQSVTSSGDIYVMSGGQFKRVAEGKTVKMPIHKAYLKIAGATGSAKVLFSFPDGDTTSLEAIEAGANGTATEGAVYDLQGRRISPTEKLRRGIYVAGGRKVVVAQ